MFERLKRGISRSRESLGRFIPSKIAMKKTAGATMLIAFVFFALYWLAGGPVMFAFLRNRGWSHHSWLAFGVVVLVFLRSLRSTFVIGSATRSAPTPTTITRCTAAVIGTTSVVRVPRPGSVQSSTDPPSDSMVASDGTATVSFTATVRDGAGNPVTDGTPVSWLVGESDSPFESQTTFTSGGVATASLRAPLSPRDQVVEVSSGMASATTTVQVVRVTGGLTSSQPQLNISTGETATMTATVSASSGTEVEWFTSNGQISGGNVAGGSATATLSTTGGRPGPVGLRVAAVGVQHCIEPICQAG